MQVSKLPSIYSCQKRFLWTHKEVDFAQHPVVGLVLQVGDFVGLLVGALSPVNHKGLGYIRADQVGDTEKFPRPSRRYGEVSSGT